MKHKDQLDHEIGQSLKSLTKTQKATLYVELLLRLASYRLSKFLHYSNLRARVHWLGRAQRPRRLERLLLIVLMVISAVIFEPHEYMLWVCYWGGGVSLFVIVRTFYKLIQQYKTTNPPHWI